MGLSITTYEGVLEVDGQIGPVSLQVAGLAQDHKRDHAPIRAAARFALKEFHARFPEAGRAAITVRIPGGTELREEG